MMMVDGSRKEQSRTEQQGFCSEGGGSGDGGGTLSGGRAHPQARSRSALADVDAEDEDVPG